MVLLGILVMLGWIVRSPAIVQLLPTFAPMQFNTALGFALSGTGLVVLALEQHRLAAALGALAALLGFATLIQYLTGIDLGIDELAVDAFVDVKTSHPGRMAPNTAVCFMLTGFGLSLRFLQNRWIGRKVAVVGNELTGLIVAGLALIALIGYASGTESAYGWGEFTRMALHTTIGFLIAGIALATRVWWTEGTLAGPVWIVTALYAAIIGLELYLPLGVAIGIAYLLPVLTSYWFPRPSTPYILAALSTVLVLVGTISSQVSDAPASTVLINRGLSLLGIWVTAGIIVQQRRAQKARDAAFDQIKRANEELEQFAYVASHDLKAPLRGIDNLAHWIEDDLEGIIEGEPKENLTLLRGRVHRMEMLLASLLEYSRAGRIVGSIEPVNTDDLIRETFDFVNPPETFKLVTNGPPVNFSTARHALEQVLQNLFSNAIKHHDRPEGSITVTVQALGDWLEFSVADDGPGIPA